MPDDIPKFDDWVKSNPAPRRPRDYDPDTALSLISRYESGDRNVPNYRYDPGHTAQGHYQITNTNWRNYGPRAGVDLKRHPSAMAAPKETQTSVARLMYDERGFKDWAPFNPRLKAAIERGEQPRQQSVQVPRFDDWVQSQSQPSEQTPPPVSGPQAPPVRPRAPSAPAAFWGQVRSRMEQQQPVAATSTAKKPVSTRPPRIDFALPNLAETLVRPSLTFDEDRAQRVARNEAMTKLRERAGATADFNSDEYRNYLLQNRSQDSPYQRREFIALKAKEAIEQTTGSIEGSPFAALAAQDRETARRERVRGTSPARKLAQVPQSAVTGVSSAVGGTLKGLAVAGRALVDRVADTRGYSTSDSHVYQLGEYIQQRVPQLIRSNPDLEQEFLVGKAPAAIGQIAEFALGGWATKSPRLAVSVLGGLMAAGDAYDEVKRAGGSEDEANNAALWAGAILGPSELIGTFGLTKALRGTARGVALQKAANSAWRSGRRDMLENAIQEAGAEEIQGRITGRRRSGAELLEAAALGGIAGTATVPITAVANRRGRASAPVVTPAPPVPTTEPAPVPEVPTATSTPLSPRLRQINTELTRLREQLRNVPRDAPATDTDRRYWELIAEKERIESGEQVETSASGPPPDAGPATQEASPAGGPLPETGTNTETAPRPEVLRDEGIGERAARQFDHLDFGRVEVAADQSGARRSKVKVVEVADPAKFHYVKKSDLQGRGNARMIPVRVEPAPALDPYLDPQPATPPPPKVASPASETAFPPVERRSPSRLRETDWLTLTPDEQRQMRAELDLQQVAPVPPQPAQTDILSNPPQQGGPPSDVTPNSSLPATTRAPGEALAGSPSTTTPLSPETILQKNRVLLDGPEFREQVLEESIGGNADEGRAAVNALVDRNGNIIRLGNFQNFPADIQQKFQRGEYVNATFVVRDALTRNPRIERVVIDSPQASTPGELTSEYYADFEDPSRSTGQVPRELQELAESTSARRATAANDAAMQADRAALGLPELAQLPGVSASQVLTEAQQRNLKDSRQPDVLVEQALTGSKNFTNIETMQVNLRAAEVKNRLAELRREVAEATDEQVIKDKGAEYDARLAEFDRISEAQDKAGAEWSKAGRARQVAIKEDYTPEGLMFRAKKAKGRDLTTEERARYEQQAQKITELESQLQQARARALEQSLDREIQRVSKQRKRGETKEALDAEFVQLKTQFAQARAETRNVQASGLAALDPEGKLTRLLAQMARNRIKAGVSSTEALVSELYNTVKESGWSRDNVVSVLRQTISESDDVISRWDKTRQKQLLQREAELRRRLEARDFSPARAREKPAYNRETQRLQEQVQKLKNQFDLELERAKPGHWLRNLSALRKSWMLSGISTQAKNILGTGGYQVFDELARLPAVIVDATIAPLTGQRSIGGPSPVAALDSVLHAVRQGLLKDASEIMRMGATKEQLERHQFSEIDTGLKLLDYTSNLVFRFMSASDRVFYQGAYQRNLTDRARIQAKNEGAGRERAKELIDNPPEELDAAAKHDALVATFNNDNVLSTRIKAARAGMGPTANFALDLIMPFDRTPTNVIARIAEASPLGAAIGIHRAAKAAVNKSLTVEEQRQFSRTMGRATAGTAIIALGWALADSLLDVEEYQVFLKIPGYGRIDLASVSPVGNLLALGARLKKNYDEGKPWEAAKSLARVPLSQPLLQAGANVTDLVKDPERSLTKQSARLASSFIPFGGAVRDAAKLLDPEERRHADPKSFTQQIQQGIPVLREGLPVSRSKVFGAQARSSPVTDEIRRLDMRITGAMISPKETPQGYEQRRAAMNPAIVGELEQLITEPRYRNTDDEGKRKQIRSLISRVAAQHRPEEAGSRPSRPSRPSRASRPTRQ